jgi:RNA polymerase sigma-70 factor, ECF subfamily
VADGDQERFERLYRQHFRAVLRYALARLEPERAKDAAAETFLIAWRRLDDVPAEPAAWLFGVARKVVAGQVRGDTRRAALTAQLDGAARQQAGTAWPDPADQVAQRDSALAALARLGEADREVLRLVAWDGLSAEVAAAALGVSRPRFAVRLHRARRRLAAELASEDGPAAAVARPPQARSARDLARPPRPPAPRDPADAVPVPSPLAPSRRAR